MIAYRCQLDVAWRDVLLDLTIRIERGELFPTGYQTMPALQQQRTPIPHQWAMEFRIDPLRSTIDLKRVRYVNVLFARVAPTLTEGGIPAASPVKRIDPSTLGDLDDETVLALLEEHCRRVVEKPGAKMIGPRKVSFGPILLRKLHHRFGHGEMRSTLEKEAEELEAWLKTKVTGFQLPGVGAIANICREDYRALKYNKGP